MSDERSSSPRKFWCNFCGYASDDRDAYLRHSCTEELAARGKSVPDAQKENHCR